MNDNTLARIADALERIADALELNSATPDPQVANTEAPDQLLNAPVIEPAAEPEKVIEPAQPETRPSVTLDQIRKMVVTLSAMGNDKKDAVREIVMSYGRNVSSIPAEKYIEVMDRLTALQEG